MNEYPSAEPHVPHDPLKVCVIETPTGI